MISVNFLILAVLALIPIQLNKFFFLNFSYVLGIPIDYRALSIYFSDLVILPLIAVYLIKNFKKLPKLFRKNKALLISLALFNLYLLLNNIFNFNSPITFYFSLRILSFSLLFVIARETLSRPKIKNQAYLVISLSLIWQSLIIILQFLSQHSLNLWLLGERSFDASTVSIANINLFGIQLLRSYGTFPHPNVAASFLVLSLIFLRFLSPSKSTVISKIQKITTILAAIALVLTFSRVGLMVFALYLLFLVNNLKVLIFQMFAVSIGLIIILSQLLSSQLPSIAERLILTEASLDIASRHTLFGVGNTNFLVHLADLNLTSLAQTRLIQPVHNVPLLILAENGLLGFLLFACFLFFVSQKVKDKTRLLLFLAILIFTLFDHFLWTLHQGQLLFWLALAIISASAVRTRS